MVADGAGRLLQDAEVVAFVRPEFRRHERVRPPARDAADPPDPRPLGRPCDRSHLIRAPTRTVADQRPRAAGRTQPRDLRVRRPHVERRPTILDAYRRPSLPTPMTVLVRSSQKACQGLLRAYLPS